MNIHRLLKAFKDDRVKFNVAHGMIFVIVRVENFARKGENAGYQYFLIFPCF